MAGTAAQAAETVGRLRPRAFDAFALAPCPDLRPLVDEFVPVGGAEEEALRDRCRLLARQIVADMAAQMPVDSELAAHVLPMVCEDYLFGSLRLARAVELAVADGRWDAVAVTASAHRRMFGALAETVARRRRPAAAV
ncbi:MAG TPA: hypothetical protein VK196_05955, partial [Magnetospirillum sp.]|nr:hypothetical protein [Magnetospirillum sp.]